MHRLVGPPICPRRAARISALVRLRPGRWEIGAEASDSLTNIDPARSDPVTLIFNEDFCSPSLNCGPTAGAAPRRPPLSAAAGRRPCPARAPAPACQSQCPVKRFRQLYIARPRPYAEEAVQKRIPSIGAHQASRHDLAVVKHERFADIRSVGRRVVRRAGNRARST